MKRFRSHTSWGFIHRAVFIGIAITITLQIATATSITDDFSNGNGSAFPDQYPGQASNGWLTGWTLKSGGGGFTASSVTAASSSSPLRVGSGNYLSLTGASSSTTSVGYFGLNRQHDSSVVNLSQPLTYTFDYRIDYAPSAADQYYINSSSVAANDNANATWYISNGATYWTFYNGTKAGGAARLTSTVAVIAGHTYNFVVNVDPASQSWTATVTDLSTGASDSSITLGFRTNVTTDGSYLNFMIWDTEKNATDTFGFSVDNISIVSAIPEVPTVAYLLLGLPLSFLAVHLRKRLAQA